MRLYIVLWILFFSSLESLSPVLTNQSPSLMLYDMLIYRLVLKSSSHISIGEMFRLSFLFLVATNKIHKL